MTQVFTPNNSAGYCTKCKRGYAIGPHVCPAPTGHQLDMVPLDAAALEHAAEQLPKARDVPNPRLPLQACMHPVDAIKQSVEGELVRTEYDPVMGEVEHAFAAGDIVTHNLGGGRWRVLELNAPGDSVHVECVDATDALSGGEPWAKVGDREWNLTRRYSLVEDAHE